MIQIQSIFRREFSGYFSTPIAYVFIVIFLFLNGIFTFFLGDIYARGQADLATFSHGFLGFICFLCLPLRCAFGPRKGESAR